MKRLLRPKPLFAAALVLAAAVAALAIWRAGWSKEEPYPPIYLSESTVTAFRLRPGDPGLYLEISNGAELAVLRASYSLPGGDTPIGDDDLGAVAGTIGDCDFDKMLGGTVWYYADWEDDRLLIAERPPFGYRLYFCSSRDTPWVGVDETPQALFDAFGLPDGLAAASLAVGEAEAETLPLADGKRLIELLLPLPKESRSELWGPFVERDRPRLQRVSLVTLENEQGEALRLSYYPDLHLITLYGGVYRIPKTDRPALEAMLGLQS